MTASRAVTTRAKGLPARITATMSIKQLNRHVV